MDARRRVAGCRHVVRFGSVLGTCGGSNDARGVGSSAQREDVCEVTIRSTRGGDGLISEQASQPQAGQDQRGVFVARSDELEEQVRADCSNGNSRLRRR